MRQNPLSTRCAWCGLVRDGSHWRTERRKQRTQYSHGICPACRKGFFPGVKGAKAAPPRPAWRRAATPWAILKLAAGFIVLLTQRWFKLKG
jgi:hypothetical protein